MKLTLTLIIGFTLLFISCKKDQTLTTNNALVSHDTIFPQNYYPVYPGSSWTYLLNDSTLSTLETEANYQLHSYRNSISGTYSDSVYVPFFNSNPIYGYNKIAWVQPPFGDYYKLWPIISENVGDTFQRDWEDTRYGDFSEKVEVTQKYFDGNDSIIVLEGHWIWGPNVNNKSYQTYKKGIGLTFESIVDTTTNDTLSKKVLINYSINN